MTGGGDACPVKPLWRSTLRTIQQRLDAIGHSQLRGREARRGEGQAAGAGYHQSCHPSRPSRMPGQVVLLFGSSAQAGRQGTTRPRRSGLFTELASYLRLDRPPPAWAHPERDRPAPSSAYMAAGIAGAASAIRDCPIVRHRQPLLPRSLRRPGWKPARSSPACSPTSPAWNSRAKRSAAPDAACAVSLSSRSPPKKLTGRHRSSPAFRGRGAMTGAVTLRSVRVAETKP
jgi:hypothetical protein